MLPGDDRIERYNGELVGYVRSLFPMRFYQGEKWSTMYMATALLRVADMAEAVLAHLPARRDLDAAAAVRSLYELAVTVAWVLADPEPRKELWEGEALVQQLKLHNDLAGFGETLLSVGQQQAAANAKGMPPLTQRAGEADVHWATRVRGLHAASHLLSFRGLYNVIYRLGSQPTHGSIASLLPYIDQEPNRYVVRPLKPDNRVPYALVSPLLAITLTIAATRVTWIDEAKVRQLNDLACASGPIVSAP